MKILRKVTLIAALSSTLLATSVALIETVSVKDATGDVAKVYSEMNASWKMVPNAMKLYSNNPEILRHKWDSFKLNDKYESIDAKLQSMIRMLISVNHECNYCIGFNEGFLINVLKVPAADVMAMKKDPSLAPLNRKQKALLLFVLKATEKSKSVTSADISELKKLGWSDAEIFFATNYAAQMVASDILLNAFKVEIDY